MKIVCPNCRESYIFDFDKIDYEYIAKTNQETSDFLTGEIDQINNIINICEKDTINSINQLKNIKTNILSLIDKIKDCIFEIDNLCAVFKDIKENRIPKSNIERGNIKGIQGWENYVANALFNQMYKNGDVYNDILIKAAIVGQEGKFWAYSSNFHLQPFEYEKIKIIFSKEENNSFKTLMLEGENYEISSYKPGFSVDIKRENMGGTIARTKKSYIIGIFNSNVDYRLNGVKKKQNLDLCHKIVVELAENLISMNY